MNVKFWEDTMKLPPPIDALDTWLMYQAQSLLCRGGKAAELPTAEQAKELFSRFDVSTRQPVE